MKTSSIIIAACALIAFASCSQNKKAENQEAEEENHEELVLTQTQINTVGIALGHVEEKELGGAIKANGELRLNPQDKADVTPIVGGIVRQICVVEGQKVRVGQTVAYIENTEIVEVQKNYLVALKETEVAKQEMQRQKSLAAQGAGVQKTLQQATADYEISNARLTGLLHQLRQMGISPKQVADGKIVTRIPVCASLSGVVGKVFVSTGSYVDATAPLMQIADNSAVYACLNVFERNIAQVEVGQDVDLVVTNSPGTHLKGRVQQINRSFDADTKAVAVHVHIVGKEAANLIAGMYVSGSIKTGQKKVKALPDNAIVRAEGRKFVFVLDETTAENGEKSFRFRRAEVVTGVSELGYTQVDFVTSADANATVVTDNAFYLASMAADHGEE
ncbi:membrane fusion protein, cobalt-zinc-cadmium efflux system [Bacteroidales bacterium KHT7]|nr:membrane fusion protein, cobalt-zinc-cadmium efflux system [Bacteroidales bacterium KHT7]